VSEFADLMERRHRLPVFRKSPSLPIVFPRFVFALALSASALVVAQNASLDLRFDPAGLQPDVQIRDFENRNTEEYRVNGNLYMIKVKPDAGPSYYLVDPDGSGDYEMRRDSPSTPLSVPQWALTRW